MNPILYSVIIPGYNIEKYHNNIVSFVAKIKEKNTSVEFILINDGSKDNTDNCFKNEHNILYYKQDNKGVSVARNKGLELASGKFIIFLDADDTLDEKLFNDLTEQINKNHDVDLISFSFIREGGQYRKSQSYSKPKCDEQIFTNNEFLKLFLLREINQHLCSFTIRKNIIDQYNLRFDESMHYGEDVEFQIRCMFHANKIMYLSENYFTYSYNELSVTNNYDENKRTSPVIIFNKIEQYLKEYNGSAILPYLNLFYTYNIFGIFKQMIIHKSESNLGHLAKEAKPIINKKIPFNPINKQSIVVVILRFLYQINPNLLFFVLRKMF